VADLPLGPELVVAEVGVQRPEVLEGELRGDVAEQRLHRLRGVQLAVGEGVDVGVVDHHGRERVLLDQQGDVAQRAELRPLAAGLEPELHAEVAHPGAEVGQVRVHLLVQLLRRTAVVAPRVAHDHRRPHGGGQLARVVEAAQMQLQPVRLLRGQLREVGGVDRQGDSVVPGHLAEPLGFGLLEGELLHELDLALGEAVRHQVVDRGVQILRIF
jgi:hypothetical protein